MLVLCPPPFFQFRTPAHGMVLSTLRWVFHLGYPSLETPSPIHPGICLLVSLDPVKMAIDINRLQHSSCLFCPHNP